jgi:integrase
MARTRLAFATPRPTDPRLSAPGIRRHGAGWQVVAKVRGERSYHQFPADATLTEMQEWQADERATLRLTLPKVKAGTFPDDAQKYLKLADVRALDDYAQREQHITWWAERFKAKRRRRITTGDIEAARDELLEEGYAPGSVNKRLRALSNVWTLLDGRRAPNPVREVAECEEPDPEARGLPYDVIEAILAAIPETAIGVKKDGTRTTGKGIPRPSKTKARLRVIAYTGLSHKMLKALTRDQVTLFEPDAQGRETGGTMLVAARRKGKKKRRAADKPRPKLLPLIPEAAAAFRAFDRLDCWGEFSNSSMWKAFQRACKTLGLEGLRPYDFRHSMLSAVYADTKDLRVTGEFGGHRSERTSARYTLAAVAPHVQAAADKLHARFAATEPLAPTIGAHDSGEERK